MGILLRIASFVSMLLLLECSQQYDNMVSVPFDVFSLSETGCVWIELIDPLDNEVAVVNSNAELKNYMICIENKDAPSIDFSRHSLLLVRGVTPYGTRATIKNLQYLPNCSYIMNVELAPNLAAVTTNWQIAIITSKLEDDTKIQLHVENE